MEDDHGEGDLNLGNLDFIVLPEGLPHCKTIYFLKSTGLSQCVLGHLQQGVVIYKVEPEGLLDQFNFRLGLIGILRRENAPTNIQTASDLPDLLLKQGDIIFLKLKLFQVHRLDIPLVKLNDFFELLRDLFITLNPRHYFL